MSRAGLTPSVYGVADDFSDKLDAREWKHSRLSMTIFPEIRKCPECGAHIVPRSKVYPDGTNCWHCLKHIEINTSFTIPLVLGLAIIMIIDFHILDIGYIRLFCAAALFVVGGPIKWSHPTLMPLRHYGE
ncbi:MAG: hypothetical protein JJ934_02210 [Pseudomonadales bacterium]|nr:hypothetical protein [Pseudomonadales bacterium]